MFLLKKNRNGILLQPNYNRTCYFFLLGFAFVFASYY